MSLYVEGHQPPPTMTKPGTNKETRKNVEFTSILSCGVLSLGRESNLTSILHRDIHME